MVHLALEEGLFLGSAGMHHASYILQISPVLLHVCSFHVHHGSPNEIHEVSDGTIDENKQGKAGKATMKIEQRLCMYVICMYVLQVKFNLG